MLATIWQNIDAFCVEDTFISDAEYYLRPLTVQGFQQEPIALYVASKCLMLLY